MYKAISRPLLLYDESNAHQKFSGKSPQLYCYTLMLQTELCFISVSFTCHHKDETALICLYKGQPWCFQCLCRFSLTGKYRPWFL